MNSEITFRSCQTCVEGEVEELSDEFCTGIKQYCLLPRGEEGESMRSTIVQVSKKIIYVLEETRKGSRMIKSTIVLPLWSQIK